MAFFPDLSPHTYSPTCDLEIVNIGWLDEGNAFPTGQSPLEFQAALLKLCDCPELLTRGTHLCWFCRALFRDIEGNGQIRVPGKRNIWYVAPTLVHHYVVCHEYLPPEEFIEAVISSGYGRSSDDGYTSQRRSHSKHG